MNRKKETTGQRLRELRKSKDLTQAQIAEKLGISLALYSRIENDHKEPSTHILIMAASFFDVSVDYLLGSTDFKTGAGGEYISSFTGLSDESVQILQSDLREKQKRISAADKIDNEIDNDIYSRLGKELLAVSENYNDGLSDILNFLLTKKHTSQGCLLDLLQAFFDTSESDQIKGLQDNCITRKGRRGFTITGGQLMSGAIFNQIQEVLYEYRNDWKRQKQKKPS